jgi:hypothetical protein
MRSSLFLGLLAAVAVLTSACSAHEDDADDRQPPPSPSAPPLSVAWYGDSVVDASCEGPQPPAALVQLLGPSWFVADETVSGESPPHIRKRYEDASGSECQDQECQWYLMQGGVNSLKGNPYVTPEEALVDMIALVDDARARNRQVVWFEILPFKGCVLCKDDTTPGVARAREYNVLMAQACAQRPNVTCLQLYSEFEDPAHPDYLEPAYTCDGIHLNQVGVQRLVAEVRKVLLR